MFSLGLPLACFGLFNGVLEVFLWLLCGLIVFYMFLLVDCVGCIAGDCLVL